MPTYHVFTDPKGAYQVEHRSWSWFGFFWFIWIFFGALNAWTIGAAAAGILVGVVLSQADLSEDASFTYGLVASLLINTIMGLLWPHIQRKELEEAGWVMVRTLEAGSKSEAERIFKEERSELEAMLQTPEENRPL